MSSTHAFIQEALNKRKKEHRHRSLRTYQPSSSAGMIMAEDEFVDFSSNDYLGLTHHPAIKKAIISAIESQGAGSGASRLITGTREAHTQLEQNIAQALGREAALLFNSGFQANSTILATLTNRHSLILADKRSHYSLLQGGLASRASFKRFEHNNAEHLEKILQEEAENYDRVLIVTETVFSMDGDRAPAKEIADIAETYGALLFMDDAHAVGVWGPKGMGFGKDISTDILLGTCGKSFGSFGAYVACSREMREYLINFCPGFIYTTALPPAIAAGIDAALTIIPTLNDARKKYHCRLQWFREALKAAGFSTAGSTTQIVPVVVGDDSKALALAEYLKQKGILATAIRPPTVPRGSARIRLSIGVHHTKQQLNRLLEEIKKGTNAG